MYVRRVVLDNVRGFEHLDFTFERGSGGFHGWNVVTGENASGKTTMLKAIAVAVVGPEVSRALVPDFSSWIRRGQAEATIAVEIVGEEVDRVSTGRRYERPFWSEVSLRRAGDEVAVLATRKYLKKGKGPRNGPWAEGVKGWFVAGYGPFRRLYGSSPDAQRLMSTPGAPGRFATMFREDATLGECTHWMRDLHFKRLEGRSEAAELLARATRLLNDDFLRNGLSFNRVDTEGIWLTDAKGAELRLSEMSEGYRAALAMLIDILRQLMSEFGDGVLSTDDKAPIRVQSSGVVLIDEVDAHLHPRWQQRIGFWLKERFPRIQFIATTHSAFVCQAADEDGIYVLPGPDEATQPVHLTAEEYWSVIRSDPSQIYRTDAFRLEHTRSGRAVRARLRFADLRARMAAGQSVDQAELRQLQLFIEPRDRR